MLYVTAGIALALFWDSFDIWMQRRLPSVFWMLIVYLVTWPGIVAWYLLVAAFSMLEEDRPHRREFDNHGSE